jgi:hypothetical protein
LEQQRLGVEELVFKVVVPGHQRNLGVVPEYPGDDAGQRVCQLGADRQDTFTDPI